jgi:hypothetical protein
MGGCSLFSGVDAASVISLTLTVNFRYTDVLSPESSYPLIKFQPNRYGFDLVSKANPNTSEYKEADKIGALITFFLQPFLYA